MSTQYEKYKDYYVLAGKGSGASKEMKNEVIVSIFLLSSARHKWSASQKDSFIRTLDSALHHLMREAKENGVYLNFLRMTYEREITSFDLSNDMSKKWYELGTTAVAGTGASNVSEYQNMIKQKYSCNEAPVILATPADIRAFAYNAKVNEPRVHEFCVMDAPITKDSVVHELLHVFGACDYYNVPLTAYAAHHFLPNSVMNLHRSTNFCVDELTQYVVGWRDTLSPDAIAFLDTIKPMTIDEYYSVRNDCSSWNIDGNGVLHLYRKVGGSNVEILPEVHFPPRPSAASRQTSLGVGTKATSTAPSRKKTGFGFFGKKK